MTLWAHTGMGAPVEGSPEKDNKQMASDPRGGIMYPHGEKGDDSETEDQTPEAYPLIGVETGIEPRERPL